MQAGGLTLFGKLWESHVVADLGDDTALLHVDRHLLHDLGGSRGLLDLKSRGVPVRNPELPFSTPDQAIASAHGRAGTIKDGTDLPEALGPEPAAACLRMLALPEP